MTTYMCLCISLTSATACKYDIQIDIVRTQSMVIIELRLYPVVGPMSRSLEAPFALVDIVRCSKSWTTVDVVWCSQCSPTNGHQTGSASDPQEEDGDGFHGFQRSPGRRRGRVQRAVAESLPKNLIAAHFVRGSQADKGSRGTCSPVALCAQRYGTGKAM